MRASSEKVSSVAHSKDRLAAMNSVHVGGPSVVDPMGQLFELDLSTFLNFLIGA
jgi:hypothetical protein